MAKKASMSIGNFINAIPGLKRKHKMQTRLDIVKKALTKAETGQVMPIYTGSTFAANSLASMLRKSGLMKNISKVAVRKHIVYVQKQNEAADVEVTTPQPGNVDATAAV